MTNQKVLDTLSEENSLRRPKLGVLMHSDMNISKYSQEDDQNDDASAMHRRPSSASVPSPPLYDTPTASPYIFSPWNQPISPYTNSPWIQPSVPINPSKQPGLIGSLVREEGHIYSLAASGNLLYTGSDSRNIHVWKDMKEFSGFKSHSGLVKTIVVLGDKIFTGHQDGKIRVWRTRPKQKRVKRIGNLPTTRDYLKSSMNPRNYVEVRRHRNVPWIKHFDAVSCMSLDIEQGILYSGSWDKTVKVWRISDYKCLESVNAHDDAVNAVAVSYGGLVFTGSADGTVKLWRREFVGKVGATRHVLVETLLRQENAVTAVAVAGGGTVVYGGASDGLVSYWLREKQSLAYGGALRGHKLAVLCLAVAGSLVVSGSADKSICVWRREASGDHTCLTVLMGHVGPVKCLAIEEEHNEDDEEDGIFGTTSGGDQRWRLYSGSLDKSVKVWRLSEHAPDMK